MVVPRAASPASTSAAEPVGPLAKPRALPGRWGAPGGGGGGPGAGAGRAPPGGRPRGGGGPRPDGVRDGAVPGPAELDDALDLDTRRAGALDPRAHGGEQRRDRKSTRLNSSHDQISYAVFCLKKKKNQSAISSVSAI